MVAEILSYRDAQRAAFSAESCEALKVLDAATRMINSIYHMLAVIEAQLELMEDGPTRRSLLEQRQHILRAVPWCNKTVADLTLGIGILSESADAK
jgi:hypothetical protein